EAECPGEVVLGDVGGIKLLAGHLLDEDESASDEVCQGPVAVERDQDLPHGDTSCCVGAGAGAGAGTDGNNWYVAGPTRESFFICTSSATRAPSVLRGS